MSSKDPKKSDSSPYSLYGLFVSKSAYQQISSEFHMYHKHDLNVLLHLFTTSLGVWGAVELFLWMKLDYLIYLYMVLVFLTTPMTTAVLHTTMMLCMLLFTPSIMQVNSVENTNHALVSMTAAIVLGYGLQDVSHWLFAEPTYMSSYMTNNNNNKLVSLLLHSFWLLALVIDSVLMRNCFFYTLFVSKNRTIRCAVNNKQAVNQLREWIHHHVAPISETTHVWPHTQTETSKNVTLLENDASIYASFRQVFDTTHYTVKPVVGMNEIYVTAVGAKTSINSDAVFYTPHTDGPYWWLPGCSLYRVLIGVTPNSMVRTRFNLQHESWNSVVDMYDVLGFDYNRELHWIDHVPEKSNDERRSLIKLHYIVYPRGWENYGNLAAHLNTTYNTWARNNFLKTLRPSHISDYVLAWWIWLTTWCNALLEEYVGWNNLVFVACAYMLGEPAFTILTSFRHYLIYICTLAYSTSTTSKQQPTVAHGYLMRDAKLYKTLAFMQLGKRMVPLIELPRDIPALLLCMLGFSITLLATAQLGFLRTYFGSELGLCKPKWIDGFPYNYIPHPMIVGQLVAFATMLVWWRQTMNFETTALITTHISLYVIHMVQEILTSSY